jgi:hypothetical protein
LFGEQLDTILKPIEFLTEFFSCTILPHIPVFPIHTKSKRTGSKTGAEHNLVGTCILYWCNSSARGWIDTVIHLRVLSSIGAFIVWGERISSLSLKTDHIESTVIVRITIGITVCHFSIGGVVVIIIWDISDSGFWSSSSGLRGWGLGKRNFGSEVGVSVREAVGSLVAAATGVLVGAGVSLGAVEGSLTQKSMAG